MRKAHFLSVIVAFNALFIIGCAPELTLSDPVDPNSAVIAQFDPTNPVPVLQIIPSPTALAERQDGPGLDVSTYPCEGATTAQCLAYVSGWPTTTPITLYFSGALDPSSIKDGIKLIGREGGLPTPIDFTVTSSAPRAPPASACLSGGNGTSPARAIDPSEIPPGIELVITPVRPLKAASDYIIFVESHLEGGLRAADGSRIEASSLFSLLNVGAENAPVDESGQIFNGLLRQKVQGLVADSLFPDTAVADLNNEQRVELTTGVVERGKDLYRLYDFFDQVIEGLLNPGEGLSSITSRDKLVLVNAWTTPPEEVEVSFDPLRGVFPFPNTELLTVSSDMSNPDSVHQVQVALPIDSASTSSSAFQFLNTRTGFSTTAPITVPVSGEIKPETLDGNVMMYPLSETGMIDSQKPIALATEFRPATDVSEPTIFIRPLQPLDQNSTYVVGLKKGIKAFNDTDLVANSSYQLVKSPVAIIDQNNEVLETLKPVLQCSTLQTTGALATDNEVIAAAIALEDRVRRSRWQSAFSAFEQLSPAVPRTELLMAFTIRTQDVTGELDATLAQGSMGSAFDAWKAARQTAGIDAIEGPLQTVTGTASVYQYLRIAEQICTVLCNAGFTEETDCSNSANAPVHPLYADDTCQRVMGDFAGNIYEIRKYMLNGFGLTSGNPLNDAQGFFVPDRLRGLEAPSFSSMPVYVALSREAATSTAPVATTIFQHGFARTSTDGLGVANTLTQSGQAIVMMDLPWHGGRASDLVDNATGLPCVDENNQPNVDPDVACTTSTVTGSLTCFPKPLGCDGLPDTRGVGYLGPNLLSSRDNLRQTVIDHLTLIDAIQNDPAFDYLDSDDLSFMATSLGAIAGGNLAAYTDAFDVMVLNVSGSGIADILVEAPQFFASLFSSLSARGICDLVDASNPSRGCKDTPGFRQFLYVAQWIVDLGDPLANAIGVTKDRAAVNSMSPEQILIQMATPDLFIANDTVRALGRAYGFDPSDKTEMSHFQTFEFDGAYATDSEQLQFNLGTACHTSVIAPVCGGKKFVGGIFGIDLLPDADQLKPGLELVGNICGTAAIQNQAADFIRTDGQTIGLRTASFPPGIQSLIDQQLSQVPVMLNIECPTF